MGFILPARLAGTQEARTELSVVKSAIKKMPKGSMIMGMVSR
jgi:hypothetical protein